MSPARCDIEPVGSSSNRCLVAGMEKPTLGEDRAYGSVADEYAFVELPPEI